MDLVKVHRYANAVSQRESSIRLYIHTTELTDYSLLRADQKAKARSRLPPSPSKPPKPLKERSELGGKSTNITGGSEVVDDDMAYFWQCQSPGQTGDLKGCGFFRILDMKAEGRGPCMGDL